MNGFAMLRAMMRNLIYTYLPKQSGTITVEQYQKFVNVLRSQYYEDGDDMALLIMIASVLAWYGLLQACELLLINIRNVVLSPRDRSIRIDFQKATKTRVKPFKFSIPSDFYEEFEEYLRQLSPNAHVDTPFLKYRTSRYNFRDKNCGPALTKKVTKKVKEMFGFPKNMVTFHMWRRSAATQMAASGAGMFALKVAGRWRLVNTAEIYVAESLKRERDVMRMLTKSGENKRESDKVRSRNEK